MNCRVHGKLNLTQVKFVKHRGRQVPLCINCKHLRDRASSRRYREKHRDYYHQKAVEHTMIRKSLSLYLTMILFAAENQRIA